MPLMMYWDAGMIYSSSKRMGAQHVVSTEQALRDPWTHIRYVCYIMRHNQLEQQAGNNVHHKIVQ